MQFSHYIASFLYIASFIYNASFTICILFLCVSEEINNVVLFNETNLFYFGKIVFGSFPKTEMTLLHSSRYRHMKRQCSTQMYYEKTILDPFELIKDLAGV